MIRLRLQIWGKIITEVMCPSYCILLGSAEYWHGLLQVALIFITQLKGLLLGFFWSYYISCSIIFSLQSAMSGPHSRRRELIFTSSRENYQAIFEHMFKLPQWTLNISGEIHILKYANGRFLPRLLALISGSCLQKLLLWYSNGGGFILLLYLLSYELEFSIRNCSSDLFMHVFIQSCFSMELLIFLALD